MRRHGVVQELKDEHHESEEANDRSVWSCQDFVCRVEASRRSAQGETTTNTESCEGERERGRANAARQVKTTTNEEQHQEQQTCEDQLAAKGSMSKGPKGKGMGKKGAAAAAPRAGAALFELADNLTSIDVLNTDDAELRSALTRNMAKPLIVNVGEDTAKVLWSEQIGKDHGELMSMYAGSTTQLKFQRGAGRLETERATQKRQNTRNTKQQS